MCKEVCILSSWHIFNRCWGHYLKVALNLTCIFSSSTLHSDILHFFNILENSIGFKTETICKRKRLLDKSFKLQEKMQYLLEKWPLIGSVDRNVESISENNSCSEKNTDFTWTRWFSNFTNFINLFPLVQIMFIQVALKHSSNITWKMWKTNLTRKRLLCISFSRKGKVYATLNGFFGFVLRKLQMFG